MRRKWAVVLVLMLVPTAMYACGAELSILPDSDGGGGGDGDGGGDGAADARVSMGDSPSSSDGGPTCTPKTCGEVGAQCGSAPDGCGGALADCGVCAPSEVCGAGGPNRCGDGGCNPATSCGAGRCGSISNGCGGTLRCGACTGATLYCQGNSGTCAQCSLVSSRCTDIAGVTCPGGLLMYHAYSCEQTPDPAQGCVHCSNLSGPDTVFCCP